MFCESPPENLFYFLPELKEQLGSTHSVIDADYPHISKAIRYLWGSEECMQYMEDLINYVPNEKRLSRQGFPLIVLQELHIIIECHHKQFPSLNTQYKIRSRDPWNIK